MANQTAEKWYVKIFVRGTYIGAYEFDDELLARADCEIRNRDFGPIGCYYTVGTDKPFDPATIEKPPKAN